MLPGLLDALDDEDQRVVAEARGRPSDARRDPDDEDEPFGPPAEGELREHGLADGRRRDPAVGEEIEGGPGVGAGQERLADERLGDLDPGFERAADLAGAVDERQAGGVALAPVAQAPRPRGRAGWPRW